MGAVVIRATHSSRTDNWSALSFRLFSLSEAIAVTSPTPRVSLITMEAVGEISKTQYAIIDDEVQALTQLCLVNINNKEVTFWKKIDVDASNILARTFVYPDPWCFGLAEHAFRALLGILVVITEPIAERTGNTEADMWDQYLLAPRPFLWMLSYAESLPKNFNGLPPRKFLRDALLTVCSAYEGADNKMDHYRAWAAVTVLLMTPGLSGPSVRDSQLFPANDADPAVRARAQRLYAFVFELSLFKGQPDIMSHQLMYHARALGLWDFDFNHPSVKNGFNESFAASVQVTESILTEPARRTTGMSTSEFDVALGICIQQKSWQPALAKTIVLPMAATLDLMKWLSDPTLFERQYAPMTAAQQQFHWFMKNPELAIDHLLLLPCLPGGTYACGCLWWKKISTETGVTVMMQLNGAFFDPAWNEEAKQFIEFFLPFLETLRTVFGCELIENKHIRHFTTSYDFSLDANTSGPVVLAFLDEFIRIPTNIDPSDRVFVFIAAIDGFYQNAYAKPSIWGAKAINRIPEILKETWLTKVIDQGIEWKGCATFLQQLQKVQNSASWPHAGLLPSSLHLLEFLGSQCSAEMMKQKGAPPIELLTEPSVAQFLTRTLVGDWRAAVTPGKELAMPWPVRPESIAALFKLSTLTKFLTPAAQAPMSLAWSSYTINPIEFLQSVEASVALLLVDVVQNTLLGTRFPLIRYAHVTSPFWKELSRVQMQLDRYLNDNLRQQIFAIVFADSAVFEARTPRLRALFAEAQTSFRKALDRVGAEHILAVLWPTEFCWPEEKPKQSIASRESWFPKWLDMDPGSDEAFIFKKASAHFLRALADSVTRNPATGMLDYRPEATSSQALVDLLETPDLSAWRRLGSIFAHRLPSSPDALLEMVMKVMYDATLGKARQYTEGSTERYLETGLTTLGKVISFIISLPDLSHRMVDPWMLWLANPASSGSLASPLATGFWKMPREIQRQFIDRLGIMAAFFTNNGVNSRHRIQLIQQYPNEVKAATAEIRSKVAALTADVGPKERSQQLYEISNLYAKVRHDVEISQLFEKNLFDTFPSSFIQAMPALRTMAGLVQKINPTLVRELEALTTDLSRLEGERAVIDSKFNVATLEPKALRAYFRLPEEELTVDNVTPILADLDRTAYTDSLFGTRERRAKLPAFFEANFAPHLAFLDTIDDIYAAYVAQLINAEEEIAAERDTSLSEYEAIEMAVALFDLAVNDFADAAEVARVAKGLGGDALVLLAGFLRQSKSDDRNPFMIADTAYERFFATTKTWMAALEVGSKLLARLERKFPDADAPVATWYGGVRTAEVRTLLDARRTFQTSALEKIKVMVDMVDKMVIVPTFDAFLVQMFQKNNMEDRLPNFRAWAELFDRGGEMRYETLPPADLARFMRALLDASIVHRDLFETETRAFSSASDPSITLRVQRRGWQKYVILFEDQKATRTKFAKNRANRLYAGIDAPSTLLDIYIALVSTSSTNALNVDADSIDDDAIEEDATFADLISGDMGLGFLASAISSDLPNAKDLFGAVARRLRDLDSTIASFDADVASTVAELKRSKTYHQVLSDVPPHRKYQPLHIGMNPANFRAVLERYNTKTRGFCYAVKRAKDSAKTWIDLLQSSMDETETELDVIISLFNPIPGALNAAVKSVHDKHMPALRSELFPDPAVQSVDDLRAWLRWTGHYADMASNEAFSRENLLAVQIISPNDETFEYALLPYLRPGRYREVMTALGKLQEFHQKLELLSYTHLVQIFDKVRQAYDELLGDRDRDFRALRGSVHFALDLITLVPFVQLSPGDPEPSAFFTASEPLLNFLAPGSVEQLFLDLKFVAFLRDPNTPYVELDDAIVGALNKAPFAFFMDPEAEDALSTSALQEKVQSAIIDQLDKFALIAERSIAANTSLIQDFNKLGKNHVIERSIGNGKTIRFYVPVGERDTFLRSKRPATRFTQVEGLTLVRKLLFLSREILRRAPPGQYVPENFRRAVARVNALVDEAVQREDDMNDTADSWGTWFFNLEFRNHPDDISSLTADTLRDYVAKVDGAGKLSKSQLAEFKTKIGPVTLETLHAYEQTVAKFRLAWNERSDGKENKTWLPKHEYFIHLVIDPKDVSKVKDPVNIKEEAEFGAMVGDMADLAAYTFSEIDTTLNDIELEMATVRQHTDAVTLREESRTASALAWTTSRFYRAKYADNGDELRKAWLLAIDDSPASLKTIAKFGGRPPRAAEELHLLGGPDPTEAEKIRAEGGRRPTDLDEILAATVFSEDHRAQVEKAERARLDFYTEAQRDREHYRAVRELAKQERERQRKMPVPWKRK
jgi:hypothetical protein